MRMPPSKAGQANLCAAIALVGFGGVKALRAAAIATEVGIIKATMFPH